MLGLYRIAYKISNMVATDIANLVGRVSFPAFSKLQDDVEKMKAGYVKSSQLVMLTVCPVSGGLIVLANELILVVYGYKWLEMASAMQILCLLGIAKSNQSASVLLSMNKPNIIKWLTVLRFAMIVISIYPLTKLYGMAGTAASVTFSSILLFPPLQYYMKKLIGYQARDFVKLVSLPILATLGMMWTVLLVRLFITDINIFTLIVLVMVGVISYPLFVLGLVRFYKEYNLPEIARNLIGGLK